MVLAHFTRVPSTEFCRAEQGASKDSHKMHSFRLQFCHGENVQKTSSPTWNSIRDTATPLTCDSTGGSTESQQGKLADFATVHQDEGLGRP